MHKKINNPFFNIKIKLFTTFKKLTFLEKLISLNQNYE